LAEYPTVWPIATDFFAVLVCQLV